jgi:alpha,alpha-trehalase
MVSMRVNSLTPDEVTPTAPRRFLIDVEDTMRIILEQEDTDDKWVLARLG